MSRPARGRGLKLDLAETGQQAVDVVLRPGAWIETTISPWLTTVILVAPRAGVWIETLMIMAAVTA